MPHQLTCCSAVKLGGSEERRRRGERLAIGAENDNTGASSPHHHRDTSLGNMGAISVQSPFPFPRDTKSHFAFSNMHKKVNLSQRVRTACLSGVRPRPSVRPSTCHSGLVHDPCSPPSFLRQIPWAHCGERLVKTYHASRLILLPRLPLSPSASLPLRRDEGRGRHQRFAQHNNAAQEKSASSAH